MSKSTFPWSPRCPYSVVVDEHVLLIFGASHSLLKPLQYGAVTRVLHIVLRLGQQQLPRRCIQVLFTSILIVAQKQKHHQQSPQPEWILKPPVYCATIGWENKYAAAFNKRFELCTFSRMPSLCFSLKSSFLTLKDLWSSSSLVGSACRCTSEPLS